MPLQYMYIIILYMLLRIYYVQQLPQSCGAHLINEHDTFVCMSSSVTIQNWHFLNADIRAL